MEILLACARTIFGWGGKSSGIARSYFGLNLTEVSQNQADLQDNCHTSVTFWLLFDRGVYTNPSLWGFRPCSVLFSDALSCNVQITNKIGLRLQQNLLKVNTNIVLYQVLY